MMWQILLNKVIRPPDQLEWGSANPLFTAMMYRFASLFFLVVAVEILIGALWREFNQFAPDVITSEVSAEFLWAIPLVMLVLAGLVSLWILRVRISEGIPNRTRTADPAVALICVVSVVGVLAGAMYIVWMRWIGEIDVWSLPYLAGVLTLWFVCLLSLQQERIASGVRKWGFSFAGFDYRDVLNIVVIVFLFFSVTHLVVEY
ncbi:MAG: hypothetical protein AAFQ57_06025, partial [Cyanobacteria bacterium J06626_14]